MVVGKVSYCRRDRASFSGSGQRGCPADFWLLSPQHTQCPCTNSYRTSQKYKCTINYRSNWTKSAGRVISPNVLLISSVRKENKLRCGFETSINSLSGLENPEPRLYHCCTDTVTQNKSYPGTAVSITWIRPENRSFAVQTDKIQSFSDYLNMCALPEKPEPCAHPPLTTTLKLRVICQGDAIFHVAS